VEEIQLKLNERHTGAFYLIDGETEMGQMEIGIKGSVMTVYHTEVKPEFEGKGLAKKLFHEMVSYARSNQLKVIAICPYVHAQFKRHAEEFSDIWEKR
jgi:uncharacterized protein